MQAKTIFLCSAKLIGYFFSAVSVVPSKTCIGPLPRIKISFPLSSSCTEVLISASKIITFLPIPLLGNVTVQSYFIFWIYLHLLLSAFFTSLIEPNEGFPKVKSPRLKAANLFHKQCKYSLNFHE